jgi:hypothetical protein
MIADNDNIKLDINCLDSSLTRAFAKLTLEQNSAIQAHNLIFIIKPSIEKTIHRILIISENEES